MQVANEFICADSYRSLTKKSAAPRLWKDLLNSQVADRYSPLSAEPLLLFGEAVSSFQARAYSATSLLCRATVEAAAYIFLTRKPAFTMKGQSRKGAWQVVRPQKNRNGKQVFVRVGLERLLRHLKDRRFLEEGLVGDLERIKDHGDVIAHVAARLFDIFDLPPNREPRLWVSKDQARADLRDAERFLIVLSNIIETRPELMGPPEKW